MDLLAASTIRLRAFRDALLAAEPAAPLRFELPDGALIPSHYHVTEVGRVRKDFIDCGGTVRSSEQCVLQLWVADDREHRLEAAKLARIIDMSMPLLRSDALPVEVEYDVGVITQFPVRSVTVTADGITVHLQGKHTACLAQDRCGCGTEAAATSATSAAAKCCS